jgi:signal peptidase I
LTGQGRSSRHVVRESGRPAAPPQSEVSPPAGSNLTGPPPEQPPLEVEASLPPPALDNNPAPESGSSVPAVPGLALSQALGRASRTAAAGPRSARRPGGTARTGWRALTAPTTTGRRLIWDLLQAALLALVVLVAIRSLAQSFRVQGASMEPTYHEGQALLINRLAYFHVDGTPLEHWLPVSYQGSVAYLFGGPRRGDVAVFHAVNERNREYLKRIVGLPGDTVLIDQGVLQVNGRPVEEPYLAGSGAGYTFPPDRRPTVVPDGSYFVLGDNRAESIDSHDGWFVPVENLVGQVWLTYWPPANWPAAGSTRPPDAEPRSRYD